MKIRPLNARLKKREEKVFKKKKKKEKKNKHKEFIWFGNMPTSTSGNRESFTIK